MKVSKSVSLAVIAASALLMASCSNNPKSGACRSGQLPETVACISGKADIMITGNIITMDSHRMKAGAMTVNGAFALGDSSIGSSKPARRRIMPSSIRISFPTPLRRYLRQSASPPPLRVKWCTKPNNID